MAIEKVLIVDDSKTSRMLIAEYIKIIGFGTAEIAFAEDGLEALDILQNEEFDLIITDLLMPKADGVILIKRIRLKEKSRTTPVLVLTSLNKESAGIPDEYMDHVVFIRKPCTPEKLHDAAKEIL